MADKDSKQTENTPIKADMFDNGDDYVVSCKMPNKTAFEITMGDYDDAHLLMELLSRARQVVFNVPA